MLQRFTRRTFTRIGVIAGYQSADYKGAELIKLIQDQIPDAKFFGTGGPKMQAIGGFKNFGDINAFMDKPFHPRVNRLLDAHQNYFLPVAKINWTNFKGQQKMIADGIMNEATKADMIVCIGNELLTDNFLRKVRKNCASEGVASPITVLIEGSKKLYNQQKQAYLDFFLNTLPMKNESIYNFDFPGKFIGKQSVFDTYKFILGEESDTLKINKTDITLQVEEKAFQVRQKFREQNNISDSDFVIFAYPGNTKQEISANIPVLKAAITKMITERSSTSKRLPITVLTLDDFDYSSLKSSEYKLIAAKSNLCYECICAADVGAIQNGEFVLEAAVLQLPTVILDPKTFYYSYVTLMYNVFSSDLNVAANNELLPETTGRHFPEKIAEYWETWLNSPKLRYRIARDASPVLLRLMPEGEKQSFGDKELESEMREFREPKKLMTEFLVEKVREWSELKKGAYGKLPDMDRRRFVFGTDNA